MKLEPPASRTPDTQCDLCGRTSNNERSPNLTLFWITIEVPSDAGPIRKDVCLRCREKLEAAISQDNRAGYRLSKLK